MSFKVWISPSKIYKRVELETSKEIAALERSLNSTLVSSGKEIGKMFSPVMMDQFNLTCGATLTTLFRRLALSKQKVFKMRE